MTDREYFIEARARELLTVKEFAQLVRVDPMTVRRRIWRGAQPGAVRLCGRWRVDLTVAIAQGGQRGDR